MRAQRLCVETVGPTPSGTEICALPSQLNETRRSMLTAGPVTAFARRVKPTTSRLTSSVRGMRASSGARARFMPSRKGRRDGKDVAS